MSVEFQDFSVQVKEAVGEKAAQFIEDYENDPIVQEGWRQQDIIDMYRRER